MKNILLNIEESLLIPDGGAAASSVGFGVWGFIRMILILALLIGALYAVLRVVRKKNPRFALDDGKIKIISAKALSPGKTLYIIEVDDKRLLVGSSEGSMNFIAELEKKTEEEDNA